MFYHSSDNQEFVFPLAISKCLLKNNINELLQESVGTNAQGNNNVRLASRDSIQQICTHLTRIPRKSRLLSASFLNIIRSFNYSKFAYFNFSTSCLLTIYNSFTYYLKQIGLGWHKDNTVIRTMERLLFNILETSSFRHFDIKRPQKVEP